MTTPRRQHNESAPLPFDFDRKSAHMRLYRAHLEHDHYWPARTFGDEIHALLVRHHAAPVYRGGKLAGYTLTERGRAVWERYVRLQTIALSGKSTRRLRPVQAGHEALRQGAHS